MTTLPRLLAVPACFLTALLAASFTSAQPPTFPPRGCHKMWGEPPPVPGGEDMMVQPRGPVHEAFATPPDMAPRPGPIVPKQPPAPIPEVPPDQRPEGDNVQWIPGYWGWDAEREDYLWISGLWRMPPEGGKWAPGSWNAVEGGHQWSPGFWAPAGQDALPYLPPPPASIDRGPSSPQPNDDSFYTPGCWMYQSSRYLWQPGYWQAYRPGLIWTPSCYNWTPAGYLFVPGYWDWPLNNRGLLFAPVAFNRPLWNTPGWSYQPSYCVGFNGLLSSLFTGPAGGGFYFGNYYSPSYRRAGFQPWFASRGGYGSPLYSWYRWHNRNNPGWANGLRNPYRGRYVQPLNQYTGARLTRLSAAQLHEQRGLAQRFQQFSTQRQTVNRLALRETPRSLPLARLPHPAAIAPAAAGLRAAHAIASPHGASPIIQAHHAVRGVAVPHAPPVPHIASPVHPQPSAARINRSVVTHHNPAPAVHHSPAVPRFTPPAHHAAPPAHHTAPPAHHAAPSHGGGHRR